MTRSTSLLQQAASRTGPPIAGAFKTGLRALGANSHKVRCSRPRRLTGSIDIDTALQACEPGASRWDYVIGLKPPKGNGEHAIWIEVHSAAGTAEVDTVLAKLQWLKRQLRGSLSAFQSLAPIGGNPRPFYWIATGTVAIRDGSPQSKRLSAHGLGMPQKVVHLS